MNTLDLLKKERFEQYDFTSSATLSAYNLVLHRQLNYIFGGFGDILDNNRINFHIPLDSQTQLSDHQLLNILQEDIEHILQMSHFVINLCYVEKNEGGREYAKTLEDLYDVLLSERKHISVSQWMDKSVAIFHAYKYFKDNVSGNFENLWLASYKKYEIITNGYTNEFLTPEKNGSKVFKDAFSTRAAQGFRKKFVDVVQLYSSGLFSKSLLGDNLKDNEIAFLTYIVKDLYTEYAEYDDNKNNFQTHKLTTIMKTNQWEKIDYSMRCKLWELIDNLTIRKVIPITEIEGHKEVVVRKEIVFDYSIVNKYLRCNSEDDIRARLAIIEQKIKSPRAYRILQITSEISSFFESKQPVEEILMECTNQLMPNDLEWFEATLSKLNLVLNEYKRVVPAEDQYNEQIWESLHNDCQNVNKK